MSEQYYNLTWNSYNEKIKLGFSNLQQKQEFVDMTLAVEGYLVKVHKSVVALVSPYLKEIIYSIPCHHPTIFLTNISHQVLTLIVEYIYTGDVQVPINILSSFLKAATQLNLLGLNGLSYFQTPVQENAMESNLNTELTPQLNETETHAISNNTFENIDVNQLIQKVDVNLLQSSTDNHNYKEDTIPENPQTADPMCINLNPSEMTVRQEQTPNIEDNLTVNTNFILNNNPSQISTYETNTTQNIEANITVNTDYKPQQYSVSTRGSLQMILNRFLYLIHHQSNRGFKRRWRCSDYRRRRCKAYVDTEGDVIVNRSNIHNHPFHDEKIFKKMEQNLVYGSIKSVEVDKLGVDFNVSEVTEDKGDSS